MTFREESVCGTAIILRQRMSLKCWEIVKNVSKNGCHEEVCLLIAKCQLQESHFQGCKNPISISKTTPKQFGEILSQADTTLKNTRRKIPILSGKTDPYQELDFWHHLFLFLWVVGHAPV